VDASRRGDAGAKAAGGAVRVLGQQNHLASRRRVRLVDAGVGADEPVVGSADQDAALCSQEVRGLVEHGLHEPRVLAVLVRDGASPLARHDLPQGPDTPLALGDGLVRDHDDVTVAQVGWRRFGEQRGEVVSRDQLGEGGQGVYADAAALGLTRARSSCASAPRVICARP
jgi:hypothetical protein